MIIFENIRYKNFISTGNVFTEIELNKHASTLVVGKNGAGKSTILDAICFALFGKPFRNINKPQLVNSITKKNCLVELDFSIGNVKYMIRRGIKPAVFEVFKNGTLLNQSAESKDYQDILEKQILKLNIKSFRQIVILGSASFVPFMALTTGQRREIIEDLLDLQIFTTMNVLLKERIANNTKLLLEINSRISLAKEKIELYNKHMVQVQKNNDEQIASKQELINETLKDLEALKSKCNVYDEGIAQITSQLASRQDFSKRLKTIEKIKYKSTAECNMYRKEIEFLTEHADCPTCNQSIEKTFREKKIASNTKHIDKHASAIAKLLTEEQELELHQAARETDKENIARMELEKGQILADIRAKTFYMVQLSNDIAIIKNQHSEYNGARIEEINVELKQAEVELEAAIDDKTTFAAASTLLKDTGIKAKIIKQYVPVINKLINKYLSALDFFVEFELNESFEETIKSRYRDEFSYESFSEGEKKRINLAIIFTWRAIAKLRNSANTNLFILDEVFDSSLDLTGTEDVLKLLLSLSAENTFIISHNPAAQGDKFSNVLRVEKKQNFSKVINA
jgi:DNA repair exonuclease SbcCD ATPase subunit